MPEPDRSALSQPLPPEVPMPRKASDPTVPAEEGEQGEAEEWWRSIPTPGEPAPDGAPPPPSAAPDTAPPGSAPSAAGVGEEEEPGAGQQWWRGGDVQDEWKDAWSTHGQEGLAAAHEIGVTVGETILAHLPHPEAAAQRRGLDIRWMRLKFNAPAVVIALLISWRGNTPVGHLSDALATGGIFGLIGWAMALTIPLLILAVTPARTIAIALLGTVSAWLLRGLTKFFGWAWRAPVTGYVLRLVVAIAVWSTAFLILEAIGRGLIKFFTGV